MSIFEYDEERELAIIWRDEREIGVAQGIEQGIEQGLLLGEAKRIEQIRWSCKKGKNLKIIITAPNETKNVWSSFYKKIMNLQSERDIII